MSVRQSALSGPVRAGALLAWIALALAQIALAFVPGSTREPGEAIYGYNLFVSGLVVYGLLGALVVVVASSIGPAPAVLGLNRPKRRWAGWAVLVAIAGVGVSAALEPLLDAGRAQGLVPEEWRPERALPFVLNAIVIVTLGPFAEELFYRGLGQRVLAPLSSAIAIVFPALAWSLAHGLLVAIPPLLVFGIALGWLRRRTESVWPPVLAHSGYNAVGVGLVFA